MSSIVINDTKGLATHDNDLSADVGSTSYADNVVFNRDGAPERRNGFKDYSTNLPDFAPTQLIASASQDQAYLHLDSGIWYNSGGTWYRKRGNSGSRLAPPRWCCVLNGHFYVAASSVIWDINLSTGACAVLAGRFGVSGSTDGTGDTARFASSTGGLCTDGTDIYLCDQGNHTIRKITTAGVVTTIAGSTGATGTTDANGTSARFNTPIGIASDGTSLFVCDYVNNAIRRVVIAAPNAVTTIAGNSGGAGGTTDGTGTAARFSSPIGVAYLSGSLYVTDQVNARIRKVGAPLTAGAGVVTTIAGSSAGFAEGTGTSAQFSASLQGIVSDGTSLYVCDQSNSRIRKIAAPLTLNAGIVTTISGSSSGTTDGIGTAGLHTSPLGIAYDGANLLVSDNGSYIIRKLYLATAYLTTLLGTAGVSSAAPPLAFADGIVVGPSE